MQIFHEGVFEIFTHPWLFLVVHRVCFLASKLAEGSKSIGDKSRDTKRLSFSLLGKHVNNFLMSDLLQLY